jgi:hypothetical protein
LDRVGGTCHTSADQGDTENCAGYDNGTAHARFMHFSSFR